MGIIDTGISIRHQDLAANTDKNCQDFVNVDGSCDEGAIPGPSKARGTRVNHPMFCFPNHLRLTQYPRVVMEWL